MDKKRKKKDIQYSVVDMLNSTFMGQDLEEAPLDETPQQSAKRLGNKLPPLNNPHTVKGRKWIASNLQKVSIGPKRNKS